MWLDGISFSESQSWLTAGCGEGVKAGERQRATQKTITIIQMRKYDRPIRATV